MRLPPYLPLYFPFLLQQCCILPAHADSAAESGLTYFDPLNAGPGHGKTQSDIMRLGVYFTEAAGGRALCPAGKAVYLHQIPALRLSITSEFSDVPKKICSLIFDF